MEEDLIQQSLDDYDAGKYSPRLLGPNELPFDAHVLEAEEDMHRLLLLRQQLQVTGEVTVLQPAQHGGGAVIQGAGLEGILPSGKSKSWIWGRHPELTWQRGAPGAKSTVAWAGAGRWFLGWWCSMGDLPQDHQGVWVQTGRRGILLEFSSTIQPSARSEPAGQPMRSVSSSASAQQLLLSACLEAVSHGPGLAGTAEPDVTSPPL